MRRGLFEALEQILLQKPELLSDEAIITTYSDLVGKCIIAALQVKRGVLPERDMSMAIYGRDVPRQHFTSSSPGRNERWKRSCLS